MKVKPFLQIYSVICTLTQLKKMKRQESNKWTLLGLSAQKKKKEGKQPQHTLFPTK